MKAVFSALLAVAVTLLPGLSHAYGPSGDLGFGFVSLIIFVLVLLAIFLLCREIVCWYWKINKAVLLLTEIRDLLQRLQGSSMRTAEGATPPNPEAYCPTCGRYDAYHDKFDKLFCPNCNKYVKRP